MEILYKIGAGIYAADTSLFIVSFTRWLELRFDFDSTGVRRAFDCLSKIVKFTVT